jgi:hypothetical protein
MVISELENLVTTLVSRLQPYLRMAAVEYKFMQPRHADRYLPIEAMTLPPVFQGTESFLHKDIPLASASLVVYTPVLASVLLLLGTVYCARVACRFANLKK